MSELFNRFLNHLSDPDPGFLAERAGKIDAAPEKLFRVSHELGSPAQESDLVQLRNLIGYTNADLEAFYQHCNGATFYKTSGNETRVSGLRIFPISRIESETFGWKTWFEDWPVEELQGFQKSGYALSTVIASGNYFVVHKGKIYFGNHEGGENDCFSSSIFTLFQKLMEEPAIFFHEIGCHFRLFKGKDQWIPVKYISNIAEFSKLHNNFEILC